MNATKISPAGLCYEAFDVVARFLPTGMPSALVHFFIGVKMNIPKSLSMAKEESY